MSQQQTQQTAAKKKIEEQAATAVETPTKRTVKYTRLGSASVDTLEVDAGTKLQDVLTMKGAGNRGEVRVNRGGKAITLDRGAELQDGDTVVFIPQTIQGGR